MLTVEDGAQQVRPGLEQDIEVPQKLRERMAIYRGVNRRWKQRREFFFAQVIRMMQLEDERIPYSARFAFHEQFIGVKRNRPGLSQPHKCRYLRLDIAMCELARQQCFLGYRPATGTEGCADRLTTDDCRVFRSNFRRRVESADQCVCAAGLNASVDREQIGSAETICFGQDLDPAIAEAFSNPLAIQLRRLDRESIPGGGTNRVREGSRRHQAAE